MSQVVDQTIQLEESRRRIQSVNLGQADVMYDRLMQQIADFENDLEPDEEIGGYLASFGRETLIAIESVGYHNPYFIVFHGKDVKDGKQVQLVQHVTQINVLFKAVPKPKDRKEANRIGFKTDSD